MVLDRFQRWLQAAGQLCAQSLVAHHMNERFVLVYKMSIRATTGISPSIKLLDGELDKVKALGERPLVEELAMLPELDPTHMPKKVMWQDDNNGPPDDFIAIPRFNVSERAKAAIEDLEPGVHQFVPVEYVDPRGKHLENRYWTIIRQQVDSVDRDHTTMLFVLNSWIPANEVADDFPDLLPEGADISAVPKIVFSKMKIGAIHLWHDRYLGGGLISPPFMSEAIYIHFKAAGLTGIQYEEGKREAV